MKTVFTTTLTDSYVAYFKAFYNSLIFHGGERAKECDYIILCSFSHPEYGLSKKAQEEILRIVPYVKFHDVPLEIYVEKCVVNHWSAENFTFTDYDKLIHVDADLLCVGNIDLLFDFDGAFGISSPTDGSPGTYNAGMYVVGKKFLNLETRTAFLADDTWREFPMQGPQQSYNNFFKNDITNFGQKYNIPSSSIQYEAFHDYNILHYIYKPLTNFFHETQDKRFFELWKHYYELTGDVLTEPLR